jgi:MFS-type transporter involved in bile tolerance (Atg22 family)
MKLFFSSPSFENEELNVKARLIYLISLGTVVASLVFVVVISFAAPTLMERELILAGMVIPACIAIMALVRFSKLRLAGNLLLIIIWLVVTLGSITAGGVSAPSSPDTLSSSS